VLDKQGVVGPVKPADMSDHDVDDPLYLMTLTISQLFLKSLQVMWDAIVFGLFDDNFPLYIKHEDLSEIVHGGQCLNISIIQLWILQVTLHYFYYLTYCFKFIHNLLYFNNNRHMIETSLRAGNSDVYEFLEPQSI